MNNLAATHYVVTILTVTEFEDFGNLDTVLEVLELCAVVVTLNNI